MPTNLYPDIEFHLNFTQYNAYELFEDKEGLNGRLGLKLLHMGPKEVERWKKRVNFDQITTLYLYGFGLGRYWEPIKEWLEKKSSHALIILEDDLGALASFFQTEKAQEILTYPQVHLRYIPEKKAWERVLEELASEFPSGKIEVSTLETRRKSPIFKRLKLKIERKTTLWNASLSEAIHSHLFCRNILENVQRLSQSFCVNRWRGKFKGVPAIICGAGPSLKKTAVHLEKLEDKALIIAGGSTLSALSHLNIKPHLGLAVDPNPREYDCLKGCQFSAIPFLYASRLYPKVFELFQGPLGYIRSGTGGACEAYFEKALGIADDLIGPELGREALSVTTLATAFATALGCSPIIFAGVDMAYADQKQYAEGVLAENETNEKPLKRKNQRGDSIYTTVKWIMESDTLSSFAEDHPDHRFFNASVEGLGFRKIPYLPFEEISQKYCSQAFPLKEKIEQEILASKLNITFDQIEAQFFLLRASLQRCLTLVKELLLDLGSGRAVVLEMDLKEEIAFEPLLACVLPAFMLCFRKSFCFPHQGEDKDRELVFEKAKWSHLKECIETHLETLR